MDEEQSGNSRKKMIWVAVVVLVLIVLAVIAFLYFGKNSSTSRGQGGVLPFGATATNNPSGGITGSNTSGGTGSGGTSAASDAMFRQLVNKRVAGATATFHDGDEYVRYVEKETGHIFEVRIKDGAITQLTNNTIPGVHEAVWGLGGNAVVLRYLEEDPLTTHDVIKTYLGYITAPTDLSGGALSDLTVSFLPDNISEVSLSPDGKQLFYLVAIDNGVSGSVVDLSTKLTKEIFRNSFSEWLPQFTNSGDIILTTKPSASVSGFTYLYSQSGRTLSRLMRNKNGLTTLAGNGGTRMFFGENIGRTVVFGAYDLNGFLGDEEAISHEQVIPLSTLPEKCAWRRDDRTAICGAFNGAQNAMIPDAWYQGAYSFKDTFWTVDTKSAQINYVADPQTETHQDFDVLSPLFSTNETYFVFTNKKDETLWAMKVPASVAPAGDAPAPELTPQELQDAQGSTPVTPSP